MNPQCQDKSDSREYFWFLATTVCLSTSAFAFYKVLKMEEKVSKLEDICFDLSIMNQGEAKTPAKATQAIIDRDACSEDDSEEDCDPTGEDDPDENDPDKDDPDKVEESQRDMCNIKCKEPLAPVKEEQMEPESEQKDWHHLNSEIHSSEEEDVPCSSPRPPSRISTRRKKTSE